MLIRNAKIYQNTLRDFVSGDLLIEDGRIVSIGQTDSYDGEIFDAEGAYLLPGLLDIHTHGRAGYDFTTCPPDKLHGVAADYARHGVTSVMPTLASEPYPVMLQATEDLNGFAPAANEAEFCGVHWEGRYMNPKKRGAHNPAMLSGLDPDELKPEVLCSCRRIHISAAYELDRDGAFAKRAKELGATLGLAHTEADFAAAKRAEEWGVTVYTHLFNAMPPLHHREGGAVAAGLLSDCFCELICDGIHICPEMVRLAYRMKGAERLVLISDSLEAAGVADGEYSIAGLPVTVKDGIARTHDGALAGSTLSLENAVSNLMRFCSIPLTDAILSATEAPARAVGVFDRVGSLEAGKQADLILTRTTDRLAPERIMLRGAWLNA